MTPVDFPLLPQFSWGHGGSSIFREQRGGRLFWYCLVPTLKCGGIYWARPSNSDRGPFLPPCCIVPEWPGRHRSAIGSFSVPQLSASFREPYAAIGSTCHPPSSRVDALPGAQCSLHATWLLLPFLPCCHQSPWMQHRHRIQTLFFSPSPVQPPIQSIRAKRCERGDRPSQIQNHFHSVSILVAIKQKRKGNSMSELKLRIVPSKYQGCQVGFRGEKIGLRKELISPRCTSHKE